MHLRRTLLVDSALVGGVVPALLWLAYFGLLATFYGVGWSVELWAAITSMAALAGLGPAVLMTPAPAPVDPAA